MKQLTMPASSAEDLSSTGFDRTTRVVADPNRPGRFEARLDEGWSSLTGIHGGYTVATMVRAVTGHVPGRAVRTVTANFLRPTRPGAASITVETVRVGRSVAVVVADLWQEDRLACTVRVTLISDRHGQDWIVPMRHDMPPSPDDCVPLEPPSHFGHFDQATALLDPAHLPFTHDPEARVSGHIRPLEPRPIDAAWLVMALDWFPPSAFVRVDPPTGGVSIDFTVHIHRTGAVLDSGEWLAGSFQTGISAAGLALEQGWLAQPDGTVLAESFHTRWTA